jgi:ATPase subunit of ABC transporter with duplicated ATPase domains
MSMRKYNCLILDEPTNHVDVEIKEALKKAILEFP